MELTKKQEDGLKIALDRYKRKEAYTCIAGYAGTGKSTLVKFIIAALDIPVDRVCYIAYTGKAANVLSQKGCPNATTAHKLLYKHIPLSNGTFKRIQRPTEEIREYKVIVVDEISMLPQEMWNLLLSHRVYVIALGDPFQLPPISKDEDNHVLDHPHIFLDEIMRQAYDSEIIRLSMWIREGKPLATFPQQKEEVQIVNSFDVVGGMYSWADQILCATNNKRNSVNNFIRQQYGFGPEPQRGDKIISLTNHWEFFSKHGEPLTNGSIGILGDSNKQDVYVPVKISPNPITYLYGDMLLDNGDKFDMIPIDYKSIIENTPTLNNKQIYMMNHSKTLPMAPYDFAYAYAITGHKSQGSQWNKVLVLEESFPREKEEHARWLYTTITRAVSKVVVVKK